MIQTEPGKCFACKSDGPQSKIWQENLETVVKSRLTSRSELIVAARDGQVQDVRSFDMSWGVSANQKRIISQQFSIFNTTQNQ